MKAEEKSIDDSSLLHSAKIQTVLTAAGYIERGHEENIAKKLANC